MPASYGGVFGQWLCDVAASDARIVAVATGMGEQAGLREFAQRFPDRYFDVAPRRAARGYLAAGLATEGLQAGRGDPGDVACSAATIS